MATARDREKDYKAAYDQASAGFGIWQFRAKNDLKVYLGDPWSENDKRRFLKEKREAMSFPLIRRIVKWIAGYQRDNVKSIKFDPVERADDMTAEQLTGINTWVMRHNNGYHLISDAFEGALKCGMNLVNVFNDRNEDTKIDRFGYNQFLLDPTFTRRDLEDCHYGMMRKYITTDDAKMLLPGVPISAAVERAGQDEMYPYYTRPELYGDKLLAYDEFQQRTTIEKKVILIKPINKEIIWQGTQRQLNEFIVQLIPELGLDPNMITVISRWISTVDVTMLLEGKEVYHGTDPFGIGDFSFTPIIAYYDPDYDRMDMKLQGIVRSLVDSQRAADKRMMSMMAMFEQQIGAGLDYEEDALVDDEDAFITGSGRPRLFKKDALAQQRARDRQVPDIPPGMFQLHDLFDRQMPKMVGVNEEMTGFAQGGNPQIAGILAKLRTMGGLIGLKDLFHNLGLSQEVIGSKLLKLYQQYPAEKVQRILNQPPTPQFYNQDFGKYDAVAVEGMITDTQRNMLYADLVQMKELGLKLQDPAPISWPMLLKNAPITLKSEVMKEVMQLEQQKQAKQQKAEQMQEQAQMLETERAKGEILGNRGIAEERRAKAVEDQSDAALNRAKTLAEINDMTIGRFLDLINYGVSLEQISQQNQEARAKS